MGWSKNVLLFRDFFLFPSQDTRPFHSGLFHIRIRVNFFIVSQNLKLLRYNKSGRGKSLAIGSKLRAVSVNGQPKLSKFLSKG